jgi:hypothetical protein
MRIKLLALLGVLLVAGFVSAHPRSVLDGSPSNPRGRYQIAMGNADTSNFTSMEDKVLSVGGETSCISFNGSCENGIKPLPAGTGSGVTVLSIECATGDLTGTWDAGDQIEFCPVAGEDLEFPCVDDFDTGSPQTSGDPDGQCDASSGKAAARNLGCLTISADGGVGNTDDMTTYSQAISGGELTATEGYMAVLIQHTVDTGSTATAQVSCSLTLSY